MSPDSSVAIGIPARGDPALAARTVALLRSIAPNARLLVFTEGSALRSPELAGCAVELCPIPHDGVGGNAACFNLLARSVCADTYILFEAGAVPAAGCFDRLLSTFIRVPRCGLTGPSTDRSWNEQCVVPFMGNDATRAAEHASTARAIERRFGASLRTLRPLHSLADFCYAVRREVIEAIGPADEDYPGGTCWELDYNIRAYRAGYLGVWTCGAYVERAPARLLSDDAAHLDAGKRRYQDKFCGGHLRGKKSDYRDHCRGEACPNFAPRDLIQIHPADKVEKLAPPPVASELCAAAAPDAGLPLVSCIMPTCNRRSFIPGALDCFVAQDYPNLELIVVDDGSDPIADLLPRDSRIRYFRLEGKRNTGSKRNFACEQARGSFIAHWDDDDWYPHTRIRTQIEAMIGTHWQVSGTSTMYYLHQEKDQGFRYTYRGSGRAWLGALLYSRSSWERSRFESVQVGEDVRFLARIPIADRLDLRDPVLTVGTIHSANTSPKVTSGAYWSPESAEKIRALIQPREPAPLPAPPPPLVSCIMPTHNRRAFVELTLQCFQAQTWPSKELVVVDDGTDPVGDLLEGRPGVRYARVPCRMTIGAKRNLACEMAQGEFIAHWDDDDWYSPRRLAEQMAPLMTQQCDATGLVTTHVLEMPSARFWTLSGNLHQRMFMGDVVGGTLLFPKSLLRQGFRYPEMNLAEDAALIRQFSQRRKRIQRVADPGLFIYVRHGHNTWLFDPGRFVDPQGWRPTAPPAEFSPAVLESYRAACLQASRA